jgi:hypothetical protein
VTVLGADAASFSLSSGGAVWVRSVRRAAILAQQESDERFTEEATQ